MDLGQLDEAGKNGSPDTEEIYARGRKSAMELLKLWVTLATSAVAAFFLALTGEHKPSLTVCEWWWTCEAQFVGIALSCMVLSVATGIAGWGVDAASYGAWGMGRIRNRDRWRTARKYLFAISALLFVLGVAASARYVYLISKHPPPAAEKSTK